LNIRFTFRIFEQLALALTTQCALYPLYWINIFLSFRIFEQLALALRNRVALQFFTVLKYFLSFRAFEQLALALKTEFALKFFKPGGLPPFPPPRLIRLCTSPYNTENLAKRIKHNGLTTKKWCCLWPSRGERKHHRKF